MVEKRLEALGGLLKVMATLRSPGGCPWDKEQTHQSLKRYLIEEAYEVVEAIEEQNMNKLCEELGDLLLQIVFHCQLAMEENDFDIADVITGVTEKMVRRHPHVFGDLNLETAKEVEHTWAEIKDAEKCDEGKKGLIDVPRGLPALWRAEKIQSKVARVGFQWEDVVGAFAKVEEELSELRQAHHDDDRLEQENETGDLLFAAVNVARYLEVDPEEALHQANNKFISRFAYIETHAAKKLEDMTLEEMDLLWEEAKNKEGNLRKR